jgi:uncharacterized protein
MKGDLPSDAVGEPDITEVWDQLEDVTSEFESVRPRKDRQLNLRVDDALLESLREASSRMGEGYHAFARRAIEESVARALSEPSEDDLAPGSTRRLRMKEVMLVLLGAGQSFDEPPEAIAGRTRLQKLLFLTAQHLQPHVSSRFEAYDFGPFEESVQADIEFLATEGLIEATGHETLPEVRQHDPERGKRILQWVRGRAERTDESRLEEYRLTRAGLEWVRRFIESEQYGNAEVKRQLLAEATQLRKQFGRVPLEKLVDYVYREYPEFTARSKIREQVSERLARSGET